VVGHGTIEPDRRPRVKHLGGEGGDSYAETLASVQGEDHRRREVPADLNVQIGEAQKVVKLALEQALWKQFGIT